MILDAENSILGRLAAAAAKQALLGEDIKIVNCEKAVITGGKKSVIKGYMELLDIGQPQQGPFVQRRPDMFVRRAIRGMLPRRQIRGREALSRVKCYIGVPSGISEKGVALKGMKTIKPRKANLTVGELCLHLGDTR